MTLPIVRDVVLPSCIAGCANGQLPADVLVDVGGGQLLVRDAAASWQDMARAASRDGVLLVIDNAYRSYERQVELFTARYVQWDTGSGERVIWNGAYWWKLVGAVTAAVPGQSNHGFGLAIDLMRTDAQVQWLCDHAAEFGWSAELQSEPWHWRRYAGDYLEDDMTPEQLAHALGPSAQLGLDGVIRVPLVNDQLNGTSMYSVADAITFIHQELKMRRVSGQ